MSPFRVPLPRSRPGRAVAAVAAVLVLALAGRLALGRSVDADRATFRDLAETLVVSGRVLARQKALLGSAVTGTVSRVAAEAGDHVLSGQLLAALDDREPAATLERSRAAAAQARARLANLRSSEAPQAAESLVQARLRLEDARRRLARAEALDRDGFASAQDLEDARRNADLAASQLVSAELAARAAARGGSGDRLAEATVAESEAAVAAAEAQLARYRIVAPAPGVVLSRTVEPGDVVSPSTTLFVLALDRETELLAQPDEKNLGLLAPGLAARASADAYPSLTFPAEVSWVAPSVDLERGTVDVRLRVPQPPPYLRTDMTLSVEIDVGRKAHALAIPVGSVHDRGRAPWVLVARGGRAVRQPVRLGVQGAEVAEVLDGLAEGELVIRPSSGAAAGERVRARDAGTR